MVKKSVKKSGSAKSKVKKGSRYACGVCGLAISIDNICGCVRACDIICCGKPMKKKSR